VLYNINVTDTLPSCLEYADNADPVENGIAGNVIFWNLTDIILEDGEQYSIEFDAEVISSGENINVANLTANECSGDIWHLGDTATIVAVGFPLGADAGGPYNGYTKENIHFTGSATGGATPYSYSWDLNNDGEFDDSTGIKASKSWDTPGTYTIGLKVTDNNGKNDTDTAQVTVKNQPPNKPDTPEGETQGRKGREYTYTTSSTDPEGDQVLYQWDWGDGTVSEWLGPYNSSEICEASHTWEDRGDYSIKVKAKDTSDAQSDWSDPFGVSMPKNKLLNNSLFRDILEELFERFPLLERLFLSLFPLF